MIWMAIGMQEMEVEYDGWTDDRRLPATTTRHKDSG